MKYQAPLSPKDSMRYTQVPADFDLQLFAAEPDVVKPIYMAWDERGRAWVVEALIIPTVSCRRRAGQSEHQDLRRHRRRRQGRQVHHLRRQIEPRDRAGVRERRHHRSEARHMLFLKDTTATTRPTCARPSSGLGHWRHARDAEQSRPRFRQLALRRGGLLEFPRQCRRQGPSVRPGRLSFQGGWLRPGIPSPVQQQHLGLWPQRHGDVFGSTANGNPPSTAICPRTS